MNYWISSQVTWARGGQWSVRLIADNMEATSTSQKGAPEAVSGPRVWQGGLAFRLPLVPSRLASSQCRSSRAGVSAPARLPPLLQPELGVSRSPRWLERGSAAQAWEFSSPGYGDSSSTRSTKLLLGCIVQGKYHPLPISCEWNCTYIPFQSAFSLAPSKPRA